MNPKNCYTRRRWYSRGIKKNGSHAIIINVIIESCTKTHTVYMHGWLKMPMIENDDDDDDRIETTAWEQGVVTHYHQMVQRIYTKKARPFFSKTTFHWWLICVASHQPYIYVWWRVPSRLLIIMIIITIIITYHLLMILFFRRLRLLFDCRWWWSSDRGNFSAYFFSSSFRKKATSLSCFALLFLLEIKAWMANIHTTSQAFFYFLCFPVMMMMTPVL